MVREIKKIWLVNNTLNLLDIFSTITFLNLGMIESNPIILKSFYEIGVIPTMIIKLIAFFISSLLVINTLDKFKQQKNKIEKIVYKYYLFTSYGIMGVYCYVVFKNIRGILIGLGY